MAPLVCLGVRSPLKRDLAVLSSFAAISFGYFGWRLLPHPGRALAGLPPNPQIFVWSFAWWPHAILGWMNPVVTHALYAPTGANLAWTTSVPGLALLFAPLTLLVGPTVSFNLAALLLPALAAWSCYRLCLHLTGSLWASLVGGYLFGFSSFLLAQQIQGNLNLTGEFVLPLVVLSVIRFGQRALSGRRFSLEFGLLMALQLSISTEVSLTLTFLLLLALALAALLVPQARPAVPRLLAPLAAGYGLAALLTAPLLVYALRDFAADGFTGAATSNTDIVNLLVPTSLNAIAGGSFSSLSADLDVRESALYLGPPTLVIVALFAWRGRRSPWTRFLLVALALVLLFAAGPQLVFGGHEITTLPWSWIARSLPGFDNIDAPRLAAYAALVAAVIVALWTAQATGRVYRRPYVLPLLAIAALVPAFWRPIASSVPPRALFFTTGLDRSCLGRNETLVIFPWSAPVELWQAESGFAFNLAGGFLTPPVFGATSVVSFNRDVFVYQLDFMGAQGLPTMAALRAFAARHGVDRVVSVIGNDYPDRRQMRAFGRVEELGGVLVAPACGTPSLRAKPLPHDVRVLEAQQQRGSEVGWCLDGYYYALPVGFRPDALLRGAATAFFVSGKGLVCSVPAGYVQRGLAPASAGVEPGTYRYYAPLAAAGTHAR